ncbi:MAG: hypothetical protein ACLP6E_11480 [Acidimicrobiales bacterium]
MAEAIPYRPDEILEVLENHSVQYVVIGGLAAEIHGSPYITRDVDVTPARNRDNFTKLAAALRELEAKLRVPDLETPLEVPLDEWSFDQGTKWTYVTKHGNLDIALLPDGTRGYDDLRRAATREQITDSLDVSVASLADVIRSKEAAGREKDRAVLPMLRRVLERSHELEREGPEVEI